MSQIMKKWIGDHQVDSTKIDPSYTYNMQGLNIPVSGTFGIGVVNPPVPQISNPAVGAIRLQSTAGRTYELNSDTHLSLSIEPTTDLNLAPSTDLYSFLRGTTTGPSDLSITARDINNNLIDPYQLFYAIYDFTTGIEVLQGPPTNTPVRASIGQYFAQITIPADGNIGVWRIRWTLQETPTDPVYQSVQEFQIVGSSVIPVSFSGDANTDGLNTIISWAGKPGLDGTMASGDQVRVIFDRS